MSRFTPVVLAMAAFAGVLTAPAAASATPINSPYVQAAADVSAGGALLRDKKIVSVTKPATGQYCVRVAPDVDVANSVVQVELYDAFERTFRIAPTPQCGNAANTITVLVWNNNGGTAVDARFIASVH
ncbi:hypothetical protein [Streptomyces sp. NPDC059957]|uniref:hypothetical protein n=1 Tax=unclassified Streptomyces TaxID=2593676 RepID=UPI0036565128